MIFGKLFIIATPIGNLGDITLRALETLKSVDVILCEDTRVTSKLLAHFEISKTLVSYHHHSDETKVQEIKEMLESGKNIALVTDAGTPGISDPGNRLVASVISTESRHLQKAGRVEKSLLEKNDIEFKRDPSTPASPPVGESASARDDIVVVPIPGVSAVVTALSISGFPTDKFLFLGFPPHKKGRKTFFETVAQAEHTVVFYESSHRILKCLDELAGVLREDQQICVCRELTKKFESIYRGTIKEILEQKISDKGEFVIVISR